MQRDRDAILSLIALGRITPAEAERLLVVWNEGREEHWVMAGCVAAGLSQVHAILPLLARFAHTLAANNIPALHHALTVLNLWNGGIL
ncbi:MAG TPA: hypothetical protein VGG85_02865 [Terracidiphilus sp.]|jgi:hypothetical protein